MQGDNYFITWDFYTTVWFWQPDICLEAIKYEKAIFFQKRNNFFLKKIQILPYKHHMHQWTNYEI